MSNEPTHTPICTTEPGRQVRLWIARDEDATRISAVLEALGYTVLRELEEGDAPDRLRWAVERMTQRCKLTARERDILGHVLAGGRNDEISRALTISRATVKWHMHNIFAKTNTSGRESLLRAALQLGGPTRDPAPRSDLARPTLPTRPTRPIQPIQDPERGTGDHW